MPRLTNGLEQVLTNLGIVGDGYKLFFYETGTTTLKSTYSDEDLTIANTNPIVLNAAGRPDVDIWGSDPSLYRMILGTPDSVVGNITTIVDVDPVDNYQIDNIANLNPIPTAYWGTTAGSSTAYTLEEPLVDISFYSNTQTFFVDFHIACGASPTLKIKDLPAITLKKYKGDGTTTDLVTNDLQIQRYLCVNNGTNIIVLNIEAQSIQSGTAQLKTIATGAITIEIDYSSYIVDTESVSATDDLDTISGGKNGQIIFLSNANNSRFVVLKNGTGNIKIEDGGNITLSSTTQIVCLRYDATGVIWEVLFNSLTKNILQIVYFQTGAYATGGTTLPYDNTIPQNTEGNEFMSLAITPKNTTSLLKIDVITVLSSNATKTLATALFQDSTVNALAVSASSVTPSYLTVQKLTYYMTAGTTSSTTFKVRCGSEAGGNCYFNGNSTTAVYGGTLSSSITITEYQA